MEPFDSIICVGQTTWEGDFQKAVVQLMCEFSVRYRVLYVDYQHTYKDLVMGVAGQPGVPIRTMMHMASRLVKKPGKKDSEVYVWHPPTMLPINWLSPKIHDQLVEWNVGRLVKGLRGVMKQLGMKRPLIINGMNPVFGLPMLHKLNEVGTIYYCFDEITIARWMSRHGGPYEEEYLRRVSA
ncbi:MAG: teichuronic acid biosynthesis glycosyltransferase tuaH, partial [Rudanella sp.]|nr:teichuronic acid biosynthesis glycosyltransferase tuaH [Rudanella sp.]